MKFVWSEAVVAQILPRWGEPAHLPARLPDAKVLKLLQYPDVRKAFLDLKSNLTSQPFEASDTIQQVFAWALEGRGAWDVLARDVALLALLEQSPLWSSREYAQRYQQQWALRVLEAKGPLVLFHALIQIARWRFHHTEHGMLPLAQPATSGWRPYSAFVEGWIVLRQALAGVSADDYARMCAEAQQLWGENKDLDVLLALAFPTQRHASGQLWSDLLLAKQTTQGYALLAGLSDMALARTVLEKSAEFYALLDGYPPLIYSFLYQHEDAAFAILADVWETVCKQNNRRYYGHLFDAICCVQGEAAYRLQVAALAERDLQKTARQAIVEAGLPALEALEAAIKTRPSHRAVLASLRDTLKGQTSAPEEGEEVQAAELPVLKDPPWRRKKRLAPPVVMVSLPDPAPQWRPVPALQALLDTPVGVPFRTKKLAYAREEFLEACREAMRENLGRKYFLMDALVCLDESEWDKYLNASYEYMGFSAHAFAKALHIRREAFFPVFRKWYVDQSVRSDPALLQSVADPELLGIVLKAFDVWPGRFIVRNWLISHQDILLPRLITLALGGDLQAQTALRWLSQQTPLQPQFAALGVAAAVQAILDFDPHEIVPAKIPKLPDWYAQTPLAPLYLQDGRRLSAEAVQLVGEMLVFSRPEQPYPGLETLRKQLQPESCDAFVRSLIGGWIANGSPASQAWAMHSLVSLGTEETVRWVTHQLNTWAADGKLKGKTALDALAWQGSDLALIYLSRVMLRGSKSWLKEHAAECIQEVANERGLSEDALADRIVPTLGLSDEGTLLLDYGPRQFQVVFNENLHPEIRDMSGQSLGRLPAIQKSDDAPKAKEAAQIWKNLKDDIERVSVQQIQRLEAALAHGRRWSGREFEQFILHQPLLIHLARRLVWGLYDAQDHLLACFRVAEDRSLSDVQDHPWTLPDIARIGLVHPIDSLPEVWAQWTQLFADYSILQPFPQLSRGQYQLKATELRDRHYLPAEGKKVYGGRLYALKERGWRANGGESIDGFAKKVGESEGYVTFSPGLQAGSLEEQTLVSVIVPQVSEARDLSEWLYDLHSLQWTA